MENGGPMKCSSALPSSTATVASPAMAKHIQPQETRNQMNINMGHCIHPRDAQEPRLISPGMKPAPAVPNMLNFGSCKPVHHENGNSLLSLLSASPSFLQYDFQQQSNLKSSWGNYPAKSAPSNAGTISRSLMHNNGNLNPAPAVDVLPVYPSRPTVNSNKYRSGLYDDLDALSALITRASSRNENDSSASHHKAVNCAPRSTADGEMSRGSNSNVILESSLQTSSSVAKKHIPVVSGCPRVFCMGACGDLLVSNTGLLGILCSCHGQHMSVSNFCKHSGLPDVNPGYAVRMGNGESVAQWRKQYLQKFGGYKGKKQEYERRSSYRHTGKGGSLVNQVQLDAWLYINRRKLYMKRLPINPDSDADHVYRKKYARYKQAKGWKQLVVFKSGIHALGLYTSQFIPHGAMVIEYIGEIVGLHVTDKREAEYLSGRRLQYKSACYFFRIDKEHIVDATCKGGIARFVNHSCQPNCVAKVITVRSEKKPRIIEEVTYDYHFNNEDEGKTIPCF